MKICTISDIHCHPLRPELEELLFKFLTHPQVQDCQAIFLLGDIFDVMVGSHSEYIDLYSKFFSQLKKLSQMGIAIHYFEGNHDFHLGKLFKTFALENNLKHLYVHTHHLTTIIDGKKFYFSHGDDIEIGKFKYKSYKLFIKSLPLSLVANYLIPYRLLDWIGNTASQNSKKVNHIRYNDPSYCEETRNLFRFSATRAWKKHHFDFLFCGHAHIADIWKSPEGFIYANGGPCFLSRQFLVYQKGNIEIVKL